MFTRITRSVFPLACLLAYAVTLPAQTQNQLKGNYILAEEGMSANGNFASLSLLTFNENGGVTGREYLRTVSGEQWTDVQGTYALDGVNLGTLKLSTMTQDTEGNDVTSTETFRFAVSSSQIQAIRTDGNTLSTATLLAAGGAVNGAFVFSQLDSRDSEARIVSVNVDTLGNVTGTSISRDLDSVDASVVSGTFATTENGFSNLTFNSQVTDAEGNVQVVNEVYVVLGGKDRAIALRSGAGPIQLTTLTK